MSTRTPYYTTPERWELQHDILTQVLPNDYFPTHALPTLTKRLNTTQKVIVRAINEVLSRANSIETTTNNSLSQMLSVFGNYTTVAELKSNLEKIAPNVLEAIFQMYTKTVGDPDNPIELSKSINETILETQDKVTPLESITFLANADEVNITTTETSVYLLDEDNIKWTQETDFIISQDPFDPQIKTLKLLMTLPYDMTFRIYKN